ncbi:MAG TPA: nucleotidyltransferase family protein [Xanthomonadales bacterium]|nr:nucleotidyltransferase family protein [Xanthomonadales bacterium]
MSGFSAVVLAGERPGGSALSHQLGLPASVLVDVAGKPAVQRVIEALENADVITGGLLCGPAQEIYRATPEFALVLKGTSFRWLAPATGPSASAIKAVQTLKRYPVLVTTGDHALLTPALIDLFCRQAQAAGGDIIAGLAPYPTVRAAFPESKRTVQRYRDGSYCSTNLFAVMNPSGLAALEFWQSVEAQRKRPWKIACKLGIGFLLRYLLRQLSLQEAVQRLSDLSGCRAACVVIDSARAAVDVDSLADRELAEKILQAEAAESVDPAAAGSKA